MQLYVYNLLALAFSFFIFTTYALLDMSVDDIDKSIEEHYEIIKQLEKKVNSYQDRINLANSWRNVGILLQDRDLKVHQGNLKYKNDAIKAFDNALYYFGDSEVAHVVQLNYLKGLLYKMLGDGKKSLESYDKSLMYEIPDEDKSVIYQYKADTLLMMGKKKEAIENYEKGISILPCKTEQYYNYALALNSNRSFSPEQWREFSENLNWKMESCSLFSSKKPKASKFQSFLELEAEPENPVIKSGNLYRTFFLSYDGANNYERAWKYLLKANEVDKKSRPYGFDRSHKKLETENIIKVFDSSFFAHYGTLSSPSSSNLPIFIVGMMRFLRIHQLILLIINLSSYLPVIC